MNETPQPQFSVGDILETGGFSERKIWVIDRETPTQFAVTRLEWSPDCVNEKGCVRRSHYSPRIKKRKTHGRIYLYKKGLGEFTVRKEPVTILP